MPNLIYEWTAHHKLCIQTNNWYETCCSEEQRSLTLFFRRTAVSNLDKRTNSCFNLKIDIKEGLNFTLILVKSWDCSVLCPLQLFTPPSQRWTAKRRKITVLLPGGHKEMSSMTNSPRIWAQMRGGKGPGLRGLSQWVQLHCKSRPSQYELHIPWMELDLFAWGRQSPKLVWYVSTKIFCFSFPEICRSNGSLFNVNYKLLYISIFVCKEL